MAIVRTPIFNFLRGYGQAVAVMANGPATPTTSTACPVMNRRTAMQQCAAFTSTVAVIGPSLLLSCSAPSVVVLHDDPQIRAVRNGSGTISPEFQADVLAEFARLPDYIRKLLRNNQYEVLLKRTVNDHALFESNTIGTHIPRQIIVGECVVVDGRQHCKDDAGETLRHEIGHAVDWHYRPDQLSGNGMLSSAAPFYSTLAADMHSHNNATKDTVRALLRRHGYSGDSHGVDPYAVDWYRNAEVFAILFAKLVAGNTTEPLFQYLPRTTALVRTHGLLRPMREY